MSAAIIKALRMSRFFPAPPEAVFRAWTTPEEFKLWWRPGPWTTSAAEMNLRVGGAYRISMTRAGAVQILSGTYLEVAAPHRLSFTWSLQGDEVQNPDNSIVTLDFLAKGDGTEITLRHEKLPERAQGAYTAGWTSVMGELGKHLAQPSRDAIRG